MWRWDQGHSEYLRFESIRATARGLAQIENIQLRQAGIPDTLRPVLPAASGLTFPSPPTHSIWRQYKRVFGCGMTATDVNNRLVMTDVGHRLAEDDLFTADEYLSIVAKRFRYPYPAFEDYNATDERVYPFCAVLKYLFSKLMNGLPPTLTVAELGSKIIGNACTGFEPLEHYAALPETNHAFDDRQPREMLVFISQFSFLNWTGRFLQLDIVSSEISPELLSIAEPDFFAANPMREEELFAIAQPATSDFIDFNLSSRDEPSEEEFTEGERVRKTHVRIERSPALRKAYFKKFPPRQCDMCELNTKARYPWAKNLLELHHLLPLSSAIAVGSTGTLLTDVVPLCPTCHRGVHSYYRVWLNNHTQGDFSGKQEAGEVYVEAKRTLGA